jgi:hypothetical protein
MGRERLVCDAPERVDVRAEIDRLSLDLLRRHIVDRAHDLAGSCRDRPLRRALRDPEIRQIGVVLVWTACGGDEDVRGLDVAMHQSLSMRGVQCSCNLPDDLRCPSQRKGALLADENVEVRPSHVPHRDEQMALCLIGFIDRHHVGVIEGGRDPALVDKARPEGRIAGQLGGEDLQGDLAAQVQVLGHVDDAHPSPAEERLDPIAGERLPEADSPRHAGIVVSPRSPDEKPPVTPPEPFVDPRVGGFSPARPLR